MQTPRPRRVSGAVVIFIVLALIAALGLVQPAIGNGGPSLGNLAKQLKKLKKRVANVEKAPGPGGAGGPAGPPGPSFGTGIRLDASRSLTCNSTTVVGSLNLNVAQASRIWIYGQGSVNRDSSEQSDFGLVARLRDAGDTLTLATSTPAWESLPPAEVDLIQPLSTGGLLFAGDDPEVRTVPPFVAQPGSYVLQLLAYSGSGACSTSDRADFGFNGDGVLNYALIGPG